MSDMYSTFLFAHPTASEGAARIFDFGNLLFNYNSSQSEEEADEVALILDYQAVGNDLRRVVEEHARGTREEQ